MARYSECLESINSEIRDAGANWNASLRELDRHSAARAGGECSGRRVNGGRARSR